MSKLSVIIPVYNVSKYLSTCLDSVLNQSLADIEVILVNDASPDPEDHIICQSYAGQDSRIVYLQHAENKSTGGARNTGLKAAKSDYVTFADGDDWVPPKAYEWLMEKAWKKDACIVQGFFTEVYETGRKRTKRLKRYYKCHDKLNAMSVVPCNKVYKRSLFMLNTIFYPEHLTSEDIATIPQLLYKAERIHTLRKSVYYYRIDRPGSRIKGYERIFRDIPGVYVFLQNFLIKENLWHSEAPYFYRRILKTLLHYIDRVKHDKSISEEMKTDLLIRYVRPTLGLMDISVESISQKSISALRRDVKKAVLSKKI